MQNKKIFEALIEDASFDDLSEIISLCKQRKFVLFQIERNRQALAELSNRDGIVLPKDVELIIPEFPKDRNTKNMAIV